MLVGEFGTKLATTSDQQWLTALASYLGTGVDGIHWTFWAWNPNSADTGGILNDDWQTVNQAKQAVLVPLQFRLGGGDVAAAPAEDFRRRVLQRDARSLLHHAAGGRTGQPRRRPHANAVDADRPDRSMPYESRSAGTSPVCRYYIPPALGDSHFFGRGAAECDATAAKNPSFVLEASALHSRAPADGGHMSRWHDACLSRLQQSRGRQSSVHDRSRDARPDGREGLARGGRWPGPRRDVRAAVSRTDGRSSNAHRRSNCTQRWRLTVASRILLAACWCAMQGCTQDAVVTECASISAPPAATSAAIAASLAAVKDKYKLKAIIFGAEQDGVPLMRTALGVSTDGVPATTRMHFRVGGVGWQYLSTVLLRMVEQHPGAIALTDRVAKWYPAYPNADRTTVRMLAASSAGFGDYITPPSFVADLTAPGPGHLARDRCSRPDSKARRPHR